MMAYLFVPGIQKIILHYIICWIDTGDPEYYIPILNDFNLIFQLLDPDVMDWYIDMLNIERYIVTEVRAFETLCGSGHLESAKRLKQRFKLKNNECWDDDFDALTDACAEGHLNVVKWSLDELKADLTMYLTLMPNLFGIACKCGHLELAKYIKMRFNLKKDMCITSIDRPFADSCENGHLDIAKWLKEELKLTRKECIESNNLAFLEACGNGNLSIAKWLKEELSLTRDECMMENNRPFRRACEDGHLIIAKWLKEELKLTKEECLYGENFTYICSHGHLDIAKWLKEELDMTEEDCMSDYARDLGVIKKDNIVYNWLMTECGFPPR